MSEISSPGGRLREARKRAHMTVDQLAQRAGYSSSGVRALENGQNGLRAEAAGKFSAILGVSSAWLLTGEGEGEGIPFVRIIANIAGGSVVEVGEPTDLAPLPPGGSAQSAALEVKDGSLGDFADAGALIYVEDLRQPLMLEMLGRYCLISVVDGPLLFRRVFRGSAPGLYMLEGGGSPTVDDVKITWAGEPIAVVPGAHARRIVRRGAQLDRVRTTRNADDRH